MISSVLIAGLLLTAPPEPFTESIDVRVVNVEAVVTDGRGERVRGLTSADFRLLVDGKEVPIDYFTEVADGEAASNPAKAGGGPIPPPVEGTVGRSILVFVDQAFSIGSQLDLVLDRVAEEVGRLGPEDRVAVVACDGTKLSVLTDWTDDRAAVLAALGKARAGRMGGLAVRTEREALAMDKALEALVLKQTATDFGGGVDGRLSSFPWKAASKLQRTMAAATAALRGFAGAPGRKAVLLLSGGWPMALQPQLFPQLIDTANRLGYTLYPVDGAGLEASPVAVPVSADTFGPQKGVSMNDGLIRGAWEREAEYSLEKLASLTGGKASLNSNRLAALGRLVDDTRSYYWIGFSPSWRGDGRRHAVRLEARRRGLDVRSRSSFTDLSRSTESAMEIEGRLLLGRDVQEKGLSVELGAARRAGPREVEVPLTLEVPAGALSFIETGPETFQAELPLHITSFDKTQEPLDLPPAVLRVVVTKVPAAEELVRFQSTVRLRRGEQRLRFVVQDAIHDKLLWGEGTVGAKQNAPSARL